MTLFRFLPRFIRVVRYCVLKFLIMLDAPRLMRLCEMDNSSPSHLLLFPRQYQKLYLTAEVILWALGITLLFWYCTTLWAREKAIQQGLQNFELALNAQQQTHSAADDIIKPITVLAEAVMLSSEDLTEADANIAALELNSAPNQKLWSAKRVDEYHQAQQATQLAPLALLRSSELNLLAPVYAGASDENLTRGAGWIKSTSAVTQSGNIGIAAHRDSFFRALKDAKPGMTLELQTLHNTRTYTVTDIQIVKPSDVAVLAPTSDNRLTLVTCYPFYFVGHAPKRYIVTAIEDEVVQSTL